MLPTSETGFQEGENRTHGLVFYGGSATTDVLDFALLLSHELFHAWNPHKLTSPDYNERLYWFTEGVTDFYAAVTLFRAGIWSFDQLVSRINEVSRSYHSSPERNLTAEQMVVERRRNSAAERLPYQQGFLLSGNWNAQIREGSHGQRSLDDVLREVKRSDRILSNERIVRALEAIGVPEASQEIERFVTRGETIRLAPNLLGDCAIETTLNTVFEMGFDYEASSQSNRVERVNPQSAAYAAGIREGQHLFSRDVALGDPEYLARLEVEDQQGRRWISFYPR